MGFFKLKNVSLYFFLDTITNLAAKLDLLLEHFFPEIELPMSWKLYENVDMVRWLWVVCKIFIYIFKNF